MPSNSLGSGTSRPEPVMPIVPPTARMARGSIAATAWSTGTMFPMLPRPRGLLIVLTATLDNTTHPLPLFLSTAFFWEKLTTNCTIAKPCRGVSLHSAHALQVASLAQDLCLGGETAPSTFVLDESARAAPRRSRSVRRFCTFFQTRSKATRLRARRGDGDAPCAAVSGMGAPQ